MALAVGYMLGITSTVRDELLSAGKAAAVAVVNNRIESLSDSLHKRTESIRGLGEGLMAVDEPIPEPGGRV